MKKLTAALSLFAFLILSFVGASLAMAQSDDIVALAKPVLDAVLSGNYVYAAALFLVLGVALVRRYGGSRWPILSSKLAAPFLVLAGAFGAAMATSLGAGAGITLAMTWGALKVAIYAAGGYSLLKPILERLQKHAPMWMDPLFSIVGMVFSSRVKAAEAAGRAAVKASPSNGIPVEFTDVE